VFILLALDWLLPSSVALPVAGPILAPVGDCLAYQQSKSLNAVVFGLSPEAPQSQIGQYLYCKTVVLRLQLNLRDSSRSPQATRFRFV